MRILYFADIRFPLERANGIQTMETCFALAVRDNQVQLVVRPDTHRPQRDPFAYYGLPRVPSLIIEHAPVAGPQAARRVGYLAFALGRILGARRADVVMTRDLGVASLLLAVPRSMRPPVVYESHGYSPEVSASLPDLVATAAPPGAGKLARLARREAQVWKAADGYVTITAGLAAEMAERHGSRLRLAVVPDGVRPQNNTGRVQRPQNNTEQHSNNTAQHSNSTEQHRTAQHKTNGADRRRINDRVADTPALDDLDPGSTVAYAGHLYAWKGVDILLQALALVPGAHGLIVGGHEREPDLARLQALAVRLGVAERTTFTGLVNPSVVPVLLQRAAILVLPNPASAISTRFMSPLKLFEYMAAGRAIVASDLPAIREVLHHEVDALLVAPGDPRALADAIRRLIDNPAFAATLAEAALKAVPNYSWNRRAERLEALFVEVVR